MTRLPVMLITWILEKLGWVEEGTTDAVGKLWDWIASGEWLSKLLDLGKWLYDWITGKIEEQWKKLTGAVEEEVETTAEAAKMLATSPAAALSGGMNLPSSVDKSMFGKPYTPEPEDSPQHPVPFPKTPEAGKFPVETPVPLPAFAYSHTRPATEVWQSAAAASEAKMGVTRAGAEGVAINAPTTNVVNGGNSPQLIMPPVSRNTDPTMRGLAFSESPAM